MSVNESSGKTSDGFHVRTGEDLVDVVWETAGHDGRASWRAVHEDVGLIELDALLDEGVGVRGLHLGVVPADCGRTTCATR